MALPTADLSRQDGFTLIEVLVVVLIVGMLAAIALPTFLKQERKAQDAVAKSNARNAVTQVEACFADHHDYRLCNSAAELGETGLDIGGRVRITAADPKTYTIEADSESGNRFSVDKVAGGVLIRSCTTAGVAGCRPDGSW